MYVRFDADEKNSGWAEGEKTVWLSFIHSMNEEARKFENGSEAIFLTPKIVDIKNSDGEIYGVREIYPEAEVAIVDTDRSWVYITAMSKRAAGVMKKVAEDVDMRVAGSVQS